MHDRPSPCTGFYRRFNADLLQAGRVIAWLETTSPLAFGLVLAALAQAA